MAPEASVRWDKYVSVPYSIDGHELLRRMREAVETTAFIPPISAQHREKTMTPEQLKIDCESLAEAGDSRAKATLALFAERDILRIQVKNYQGTIDSIYYIVNDVVNEIQIPGLATVASPLPLSNKKDLITAAAKIEAGAKPEEIPELKGIDPKIFEPNTDRPAGYRSPDSKGSGV